MQRVQHEAIQVDLSDKPNWFQQLCRAEGLPSTVPAIDFDGHAQTDSIGISRYELNSDGRFQTRCNFVAI